MRTLGSTVEPQYNEGFRDWQNVLAMTRFCYIEILLHIRGVARIFQRGSHHPGIADYIWFIPLLSLVYQRAQSYYRGMKAHIN